MARSKTSKSSPTVQTVQAVFDPAGDIRVRATSPSGNVYEIVPRVPFEIKNADVDWFFSEWDWEHRQCLSRAIGYHPRKPQFDNGRPVAEESEQPLGQQFDNGINQSAKKESPAVGQQFDNGAAQLKKDESPAPENVPDPLEALLIDVNEETESEPVSSTETED